METGGWVRVRDAKGEELRRRVVRATVDRVYICTDEEYEAAAREGRRPLIVGFRREAVSEAV